MSSRSAIFGIAYKEKRHGRMVLQKTRNFFSHGEVAAETMFEEEFVVTRPPQHRATLKSAADTGDCPPPNVSFGTPGMRTGLK